MEGRGDARTGRRGDAEMGRRGEDLCPAPLQVPSQGATRCKSPRVSKGDMLNIEHVGRLERPAQR